MTEVTLDKKLEKIRAAYKKRNAAFEKMTAQQKRIAIATDLLKLLRSKEFNNKVIIETGNFLIVDSNDGDNSITQLNEAIELNNLECRMCAKGALLLGSTLFKNNCTIKEAKDEIRDYRYGHDRNESAINDSNKVKKHLKGIFSAEQLDLIEIAFEGQKYDWDKVNDKDADKAIVFYQESWDDDDSPKDRLIKILKNIIKNDGTFKP